MAVHHGGSAEELGDEPEPPRGVLALALAACRSPRVLLTVGGVILFVTTCVLLTILTAQIPSRVGTVIANGIVQVPGNGDAGVAGSSSSQAQATPSEGTSGTPKATPKSTKKPKTAKAKPTKTATAKSKSAKAGPTGPAVGTAYRLHNVVTNKCLGFRRGSVVQVDCGRADQAARIRLQRTRKVAGVQLYWLRDVAGTHDCLDLPGGGADPENTAVLEYPCATPVTADNQEWQLKFLGVSTGSHKEYELVNFASGNCLDVTGTAATQADLADGLALTIFRCIQGGGSGTDDHIWIFN